MKAPKSKQKIEADLTWWPSVWWRCRLFVNGDWITTIRFDDIVSDDNSGIMSLYLGKEYVGLLDIRKIYFPDAFFEGLEAINEE